MVGVRRPFRLGLELPPLELPPPAAPVAPHGSTGPARLDDHVAAIVAARDAGFDTVWLSDRHRAGEVAADALTLAGGLADVAAPLTIGVMADVVGARHPAVLARDVTCLDVVSAGRSSVLLYDSAPSGPGVGPAAVADRFGRLGEAAAICRSLLTSGGPRPAGRFFRLGEVDDRPRPIQAGGPRVVVDLGHLADPEGELAWGTGNVPEGLTECLRSADAVVVGGSPAQVRSARRAIGRICRSAGAGAVPPLLWRGAPPVDGPAPPVVAPPPRQQAAAPVTMGALSSAGAEGAIVRLGLSAPPSRAEVNKLQRWWGAEPGAAS